LGKCLEHFFGIFLGKLSWETLSGFLGTLCLENSLGKLSWNILGKSLGGNNHKNPKDEIFPGDKRYDLPPDTTPTAHLFLPG
jgi:hypothetical protein